MKVVRVSLIAFGINVRRPDGTPPDSTEKPVVMTLTTFDRMFSLLRLN
jgi:hypothetical protein